MLETSPLMMDTRPIPLENLTMHARDVLREILDILNQIRDDNRQPSRDDGARGDARGPWATLNAGRTYRVIMLDGPRGTGKTSLMLTLIAEWNRRQARGTRGGDADDVLVTRDDVDVRVLTPLDFDPHPNHLQPYAWLVLAFHPVVEWLERTSRRNTHDAVEASLQESWRSLYEQALIGWDEQVQRGRMAADIDNFIQSSLESHCGWHRLKASWCAFIDRLLGELETERQIDADTLLVLPIDDLDLHPTMAGDLLRALRLMHHRRLVFLLTGDYTHLHDVLAREMLPAVQLDASESGRASIVADYKKLAADIISKSIPVAWRFKVPLLTLAEALRFAVHGRAQEQSRHERLAIERLFRDFPAKSFLAMLVTRCDDAVYRYRDIVQIGRKSRPNGRISIKGLIELCALTPMRDGQPLFQWDPPQQQWRVQGEGGIKVRYQLSEDGASAGDRIHIADGWRIWREPGIRNELSLTAMVMAYFEKLADVEIVTSTWSDLMATRWLVKSTDLPKWVYWPLAVASNTVADMEADRRELEAKSENLVSRGLTPPAAKFWAWCLHNVQLKELDEDRLAEIDVWNELSTFRARVEQSASGRLDDVLRWSDQRLPILAAPEFGLPVDLANELIEWVVRSRGRIDDELLHTWQEARAEGLRAAFQRDQPSAAPSHLNWLAERAMQWFDANYQDHPWYVFVRMFEAPTLAAGEPETPAISAKSKAKPAGLEAKPPPPTRTAEPEVPSALVAERAEPEAPSASVAKEQARRKT